MPILMYVQTVMIRMCVQSDVYMVVNMWILSGRNFVYSNECVNASRFFEFLFVLLPFMSHAWITGCGSGNKGGFLSAVVRWGAVLLGWFYSTVLFPSFLCLGGVDVCGWVMCNGVGGGGGGGGWDFCCGCLVLVHGICVGWGVGLCCLVEGDWVNLVRTKCSLRLLCRWWAMTGTFGHICDKTGSFSM